MIVDKNTVARNSVFQVTYLAVATYLLTHGHTTSGSVMMLIFIGLLILGLAVLLSKK